MKRTKHRLKGGIAPLCGALLCVAACGPCGETVLEADMDRLAAAFARNVVDCNPRGAFEQEVEPDDRRDAAQIEANFRTYFRLLLEDEAVAVDKEALDSCLGFLEGDERCEGFAGDEEGDCDRVFSGTLSGGARCALRDECTSDICVFGGAAACGTCADASQGELGEFCGVRVCADGLFCQYDHPDAPQCEALREEGDACFEELEREDVFFRCASGLGCADADELCYALVPDGGDCAGGKKCAADLLCRADGATQTCFAKLRGESEGDRCDPDGDACGRTLDTGLACEGAPDVATCVAAQVVDEGDTCDFGQDSDSRTAVRWCRRGLSTHYCRRNLDDTTVCRQRPSLGDDCRGLPCNVDEGGCVLEDQGISARCRAWPDPGEACYSVDGAPACGPGLFCQSGSAGGTCTTSPLPTMLPDCG